MEEQLHLLKMVQEIDIRILDTREDKKRAPEKLESLRAELAEKRNDLKVHEDRFEELKVARRDKERNLEEQNDHIQKIRERMQAIKTNKEYQAMLKEIETIERRKSEMEDEILILLEKLDEEESDLSGKRSEFSRIEKEYEKDFKILEERIESIDDILNKEEKARKTLIHDIHPEFISKYDTIRERRGGIAIVGAYKGICLGCNMNIPPQTFNEILKVKEVIQCPTCFRILHPQTEPPSKEEPDSSEAQT
ncbi:zinc ribbon domain-containing protein [Thermodesulfobacteriota bacterium]